jgi:hypothetical protein
MPCEHTRYQGKVTSGIPPRAMPMLSQLAHCQEKHVFLFAIAAFLGSFCYRCESASVDLRMASHPHLCSTTIVTMMTFREIKGWMHAPASEEGGRTESEDGIARDYTDHFFSPPGSSDRAYAGISIWAFRLLPRPRNLLPGLSLWCHLNPNRLQLCALPPR